MRGQVLPKLSQPVLGEGEREGKRKEKKEDKVFRERVSNFSLNFPMIGPSNPASQEAKLIPTARATRGHRFCGVSTTPGGRGLLPLDLIII